MVADGKLQLKGEIEAASKAEKLEWKPQEEQIDAFGNVVKIKVVCILSCLLVCCKLTAQVLVCNLHLCPFSGLCISGSIASWCSFWASRFQATCCM